jgi:KDO2-lipid IV(A) lauroyltransferase
MKPIIHLLEAAFVYLALGIIKLIGIDHASSLGGFIARMIGPKLRATKYAKRNIKFVFPDLTDKQLDQFITKMWDNLGRTFFEFPHIYKLSDKEFNRRVRVIGADNFKKAIKGQTNIIAVSGHMGNWEVGPRYMLSRGVKLAAVYRRLNNPWVNRIMINQRDPKIAQVLKHQAKTMLVEIKNGASLGILCDQKLDEGTKINFFGKPAFTTTTPAKLAIRHKIPIIFSRIVRLRGAYFKLYILPPIYPESFGSPEDLSKHMNEIYELWIKEVPEQWFWVHRRWEKEFYY